MIALPLVPLICIAQAVFARAVSASSSDFIAQVHQSVAVRALTSSAYSGSEPRPLLIYLHGFCLSDDAQQVKQTSKIESLVSYLRK